MLGGGAHGKKPVAKLETQLVCYITPLTISHGWFPRGATRLFAFSFTFLFCFPFWVSPVNIKWFFALVSYLQQRTNQKRVFSEKLEHTVPSTLKILVFPIMCGCLFLFNISVSIFRLRKAGKIPSSQSSSPFPPSREHSVA